MSQAANRSFAVSVVILAIVRLVGVAAGFAVSVIGARLLGEADFGAAGVAIVLGTVAALACNGGVNIAAIYLGARSPDRRGPVLEATSTIALVGAAAAMVLVVVAGAVFGEPLKLEGRGDLFAAAAILGAGIIGFEYGGATLLAVARHRTFATVELGRSIAALAATALLLAIWSTAPAFVLAAAASYLGAAVAALAVTQRATGAIRPAWRPKLIGTSLAIGLRGQIGNVLQFLNLRLDLLLIPALLQLSAAGIYLVAVRVSEVLAQVASATGSLVFPAVAGHPDPASTQLTQRAVRLSLLLGAAAVLVLVAVADPFLALAFGNPYLAAAGSLRILALAALPLSLTRILAGDLKGRGRPGVVSLAMLAAVVLTLALDLLLIPRLGVEGAAIASLAAYGLAAGILLAAFRAVTGTPLRLLVPRPADAMALVHLARSARLAAR